MIELYEGLPGGGKTYWAVKERLLPWLQSGRRLYVYIANGFYLDRAAVLLGKPVEELKEQVTVWTTQDEAMAGILTVEPTAAVFLDEAQHMFRSMQKVPAQVLRWFETHRHRGNDVLLTCQSYLQMSASLTRLVEATTKLRKLWFLGFSKLAWGYVRGNPEETEDIRSFRFKYSSTVYAFYNSYAGSGFQEAPRGKSVFVSPKMMIAGAGGMFALAFFFWHPWTSTVGTTLPAQSKAVEKPKTGLLGSPESVAAGYAQKTETGAGAVVVRPKVIIIGGLGHQEKWLYLLSDGRSMTAAQIAARFGVAVRERWDGNFYVLDGEGVEYGAGQPSGGEMGAEPVPESRPGRVAAKAAAGPVEPRSRLLPPMGVEPVEGVDTWTKRELTPS